MKLLISFLVLTALSFAGYAQPLPSVITGYVKDTKNDAIAGATVHLVNARDSTKIKTTATGDGGKFQFVNLPNGSYLLAITAIGQKKFISASLSIDSLHPGIELPVIILLPAKNTQLAEVVVKARRPLIVQEIDRTVVNVESMITSASSNALEVLEKTPGVTVTSGGEISLNGRSGVLVLIDGRSTYMSGQDLAAYLKSLPGGLLEKIELMDNPPARYDAAGNAIINIRLKKNRAGGFTGSASAGYTQGKYGRNNNALNLNYNYKKINLFANAGVNLDKSYDKDKYDRRFYNPAHEPVSNIQLENYQLAKGNGTNLILGADYNPSKNTTLGFLFNINRGNSKSVTSYSSKNYNAKIEPDSIGTGATNAANTRTNNGVNLNFLHKFGKSGKELSAEVNYLHYNSDGRQVLQNYVDEYSGVPISSSSFLYIIPSAINIYTVKTDYGQPLAKNARLEAGLKSSVVNNNNIASYYNTGNGMPVIDNKQSNHFKYHENIHAAYINAQVKWKRMGVQLGLRIENTKANGQQLGNDSVKESRFTKDYTQLFPAVFFQYKFDTLNKNSLTFSTTRRINRPNYQYLNPFMFMRDKYTYTAGNPELGPQYQYRYELKFQHKQSLRVGLSYNRFSNVIFQTTEAMGNVFITRPNNVAKGFMLLLNTGITANPAKWWTINADILLSYMGLRGMAYTEVLDPSTYVARLNFLNQFQFNKGWNAEVIAYYASRDLNGQSFTSGRFRASAAVQKKIWKDKGSIRLSFDDILHSWINHNKSVGLKQAQFYQVTESDTQRIGIAFTYRFGKSSFARKSKNNNNASEEEKGRVD
ncbi:MAG: TonB-dependent receptor [Chitinophagaceae bacterium]